MSKAYNPYYHGTRVTESPTRMAAPVKGTSGLQVIIGTAPVHRGGEYKNLVNKPILIENWDEALDVIGYSDDWGKYTLCQSMYACFKKYNVSPVIFVNVLDPDKDVMDVDEMTWKPGDGKEFTIKNPEIVCDTIKVSNGQEELAVDTDYVVSVDENGSIILTLLGSGNFSNAETLTISAKEISYDAQEMKLRVIGGYSMDEGKNKGISCVNDVFPLYQMAPGLILAPGWSQYTEVSTALQAATININGEFSANAIVDIDCSEEGAVKCEDFQNQKAAQCVVDKNTIAVWPKLRSDGKDFYFSSVYAAGIAYLDAANEDVPNLSPSNKSALITAVVLENGEEIRIDKQNANNFVNAYGGVTAINYGGWKFWGNNTAEFPETKDPKDRWICARRFFNYYKNRLILTMAKRVDDFGDFRKITAICDDENVWFNAMSSQLYIAGGKVQYHEEDNTIEDIVNGSIKFRVTLATYLPMEDIAFDIEFDPEILQKALRGE